MPVILQTILAGILASTSLTHSAYVWQRAWNPSLHNAITNAAPHFDGFTILAAEISTAETVHIFPRRELLNATGKPITIALRVGTGATASPEFAAELLKRLPAVELQIDHDSPESKLESYRQWLEPIRAKIAPTRLTITALPTWLNQPSFSNLVASTDGFVLQVHSFQRPRTMADAITLCDPAAAREAVAKADRLGIPFQVALPTYGYTIAFDPDGQYRGISAEGPARNWPANSQLRTLRSNPAELAALLREWSTHRPRHLTGIIWYRLPVETDQLNWQLNTLLAVRNGQTPRPNVVVEQSRPAPGLVELSLHNTGHADAPLPAQITVRWRAAQLLAGDALAGYDRQAVGTNQWRFVGTTPPDREIIAPGQRRAIGWLRFQTSEEVPIEINLSGP
jgi:hypothetical protein